MVSPTTRLLKPTEFRITDGTTTWRYQIATNKRSERLWSRQPVTVQPGQGELVKHWDSWHTGMGWSRDESREAAYAPPVYESGSATASHRGFIYPAFDITTISLAAGGENLAASIQRVTEMGSYIYAFGTDTGNIRVYKIDPTDNTIIYTRAFSGWTAPAGQWTEFGGYLYVPSAGGIFKELTTIVGDITKAVLETSAGVFDTDRTSEANSMAGTAFTILGDNSDDKFYWGAATQFDGIYFDLATAANTALTLDWEYWNGSAWTDIVGPETDGTTGFTVDGWVTWAAASQTGWATTTVNGVTGYFVRVSTTTAASTWPTANWTPPSDVWTDGPSTRTAWHMGTAGKLLWRVGDSTATAKRYVINSCSQISSGGSGGPLTAGNWSDAADYVVGKPGRNINSLAELARFLYAGKDDGLFGADELGNQTNALDFTRNLIGPNNCIDSIRWLGTLVTMGSNGTVLWQHTGAASRPIGIERLEGNLSAIRGGRYTALATAGEWLYVTYSRSASLNYLLAGRPGHEDEPPIVWHSLLGGLGAPIVNWLHISALQGNPRLWMGRKFGSSISYVTLAADGSPDPTDANMVFEDISNSDLDLSATDWGMPGTTKRGHMVEIVLSQGPGSGGTYRILYGWDGATPSTQLGTDITATGLTRRFWTPNTADSGKRPQLRLRSVGGANQFRAEKVSLYVYALPRKEHQIDVTLRLADSLDGARTREKQWDDLLALENAGVYTLYDPDDPEGTDTFNVVLDSVRESKGEQLEASTGVSYANVTMRAIVYS